MTAVAQDGKGVAVGRASLVAASVRLSTLGFGAAALGNLYAEVSDAAAEEAVRQALELGVRYFDTAPHYGYGLSETRLGRVLVGQLASQTVISTKVGRVPVPAGGRAPSADGFAVTGWRSVFDYSRDGILRSFEGSLQRLRRERVDILLLHDVGRDTHGERHELVFRQVLDEALPAMQRLKEAGACHAIGIGVNEHAACTQVMSRFPLDCIMLAGRYTLLEQCGVGEMLEEARRRNVAILIGGAFNSGLLASAAAPGATYDYKPVEGRMRDRAQRIYAICAIHGVDAGAAALQFVVAHPSVTTVVVGLRSAEEVRIAAHRIQQCIPAALWRDLRSAGLIGLEFPTP